MSGMEPGVGRVVADRYQVLSLLGRGGMGEARNAARVHHRNAVALYDVIPSSGSDDAIYLVMELIQAPTLADLIERHGKLPEERVIVIAAQMLDVLDAAHEIGVVHRDVKPSNILVASGDVVKLTDFGIAHAESDTRLTRVGHVVGTQAYLAPELFDSGDIAPAADMWSLGATLFHAAEGASAFQRDGLASTLNAILLEDLPRPACRRPLADAISALLVRDPVQRADSRRIRTLLRGPQENVKFEQPTAFVPSASGATTTAAPEPQNQPGNQWESQHTTPMPGPPKPPSVSSVAPTNPVTPATPAKKAPAAKRVKPAKPNKASNQESAGCLALVFVAVVVVGIWQIVAHQHSNPPDPGPTSSASGSGFGSAIASGSAVASPTMTYGQDVYLGEFVAGQCLDNVYTLSSPDTGAGSYSDPTLADCGQAHDAEVVAVFTMANQADGDNGTAQTTCNGYVEQIFGGSIPTDYQTSLEIPGTSAWQKGYNQAACLLEGANDAQFTATYPPVAAS